ncbi:hypothetical protein GCM10027169_11700 [Gordonia jinhuaensis]|uniref:Uncharacterized protein n=1 Tax=Gordonia jinhuaensis TaxID=1517702 RepID=A0A916T5B8_9ACTN|nr:hypothetical protein [Gordonia jinhuaensis]GGB31508.1 hypothetical protein GCM10011489_19620 [Gordonia jinhuaensis]
MRRHLSIPATTCELHTPAPGDDQSPSAGHDHPARGEESVIVSSTERLDRIAYLHAQSPDSNSSLRLALERSPESRAVVAALEATRAELRARALREQYGLAPTTIPANLPSDVAERLDETLARLIGEENPSDR